VVAVQLGAEPIYIGLGGGLNLGHWCISILMNIEVVDTQAYPHIDEY
jgi:hypothetical protein